MSKISRMKYDVPKYYAYKRCQNCYHEKALIQNTPCSECRSLDNCSNKDLPYFERPPIPIEELIDETV
jgi:hypothetical protein